MTRETKVGIAMVLLLVSVFGFLVYKRFTRPIDGMAEIKTETEEESGEFAPVGTSDEVASEDDFPAKNRQQEPEILTVAGNSRQIPQDDPSDVDDPFGSTAETSTPAVSSRPKLPTMIPDEDPDEETRTEFVVDSPGRAEPNQTVASSAEPETDGQDPFLESSETVSSSPPKVETSQPALSFGEEPSEAESEDTFANEPEPEVRAPVVSSPVQPKREPAVETPIDSPRQPVFDEPDTVSVRARATRPEPTFEEFEDESPAEEAPELAIEPDRPAVKTPAPQLMLDDSEEDRYGGYEPIELADSLSARESGPAESLSGNGVTAPKADFFQNDSESGRTPVSINGDSHVVQPGENFWSISQKKYGTGRYFQALAAHNQRQIPDAAKMKTGVTVALPAAEELERRYPNLIAKNGPSEPAAAAGLANQPGEFLKGPDGRPMYRIGARDTLSGISQKYLGRSSRWMQIFEMNRDVLKDGNSLKVGAVLRLPPDAGELQLSNQPRSFR